MTSLKISTVALAALAVLLSAPLAEAANPCIKDAKREYKDCKAGCKEDFQAAKDACLNRDHACVELCRAERSDCREATGFDAAIDACNDQLDIERQACKDAHAAGTPERDLCIDQVQVIAFQCRDAARETAKPLLRECRRTFRACARACPPANPPTPSSDVHQCKIDAAAAYLACGAECREDFQVARMRAATATTRASSSVAPIAPPASSRSSISWRPISPPARPLAMPGSRTARTSSARVRPSAINASTTCRSRRSSAATRRKRPPGPGCRVAEKRSGPACAPVRRHPRSLTAAHLIANSTPRAPGKLPGGPFSFRVASR